MDGLVVKAFCLGNLFTNCYLIFHEESKKGFIVDAPEPTDEVEDFIRSQDLEIAFILLTHAHFDHIKGLENYSFPFYIHKKDLFLLKNPQLNGSALFKHLVVIKRKPRLYEVEKKGSHLFLSNCLFEAKIGVTPFSPIEVIYTPGHTPGSVSLRLNKWLFSGDTLFLDSIGRTDIPGASQDTLIKSIKRKLLILPPDTLVYPGHGSTTTIDREARLNPFLCR